MKKQEVIRVGGTLKSNEEAYTILGIYDELVIGKNERKDKVVPLVMDVKTGLVYESKGSNPLLYLPPRLKLYKHYYVTLANAKLKQGNQAAVFNSVFKEFTKEQITSMGLTSYLHYHTEEVDANGEDAGKILAIVNGELK